jgi:hypothetical protein
MTDSRRQVRGIIGVIKRTLDWHSAPPVAHNLSDWHTGGASLCPPRACTRRRRRHESLFHVVILADARTRPAPGIKSQSFSQPVREILCAFPSLCFLTESASSLSSLSCCQRKEECSKRQGKMTSAAFALEFLFPACETPSRT